MLEEACGRPSGLSGSSHAWPRLSPLNNTSTPPSCGSVEASCRTTKPTGSRSHRARSGARLSWSSMRVYLPYGRSRWTASSSPRSVSVDRGGGWPGRHHLGAARWEEYALGRGGEEWHRIIPRTGEQVDILSLGPSERVLDFHGDRVLMAARDELGVESLRLYSLTDPGLTPPGLPMAAPCETH